MNHLGGADGEEDVDDGTQGVWRDNQDENRATIRMRMDVAVGGRMAQGGWGCKRPH